MKYSARIFVLAFVTAAMMGMPRITRGEFHSDLKRLPNMAVPRWEAWSVIFENKPYIFGGYKMPTKACKRVDVYDPNDNSWQKLSDLPSAITHINMVRFSMAGQYGSPEDSRTATKVMRSQRCVDMTLTKTPALPGRHCH